MMPGSNQKTRSEIKPVFELQKQNVLNLRQTGVADRIKKLKAIRRWIRKHRPEIREALFNDFRKPADEADLWEMYVVIKEINYTIRHLRRWVKPARVRRELLFLNIRSRIRYEPKGVVLIIAPWNFPFMLALGPFISALAAGNGIVLKPSELAPHTSHLIRRLVTELFTPEEYAVVEGDKQVAIELLKYPFDHIYFTGGTEIGKKVMQAAAKNLSSVTLELGGKCPAIVDQSANIKDTVAKIVWGKFSNAGQTCVAPDYVLVHQDIADTFLSELVIGIEKSFRCRDRTPSQVFEGMASIVDENHFLRLQELYNDAVKKGAEVLTGGYFDAGKRCLTPTVISNIPSEARILSEEVFGPILPVVSFSSTEEALKIIHMHGYPLGVYVFSNIKDFQNEMMHKTVSGGVCFNELVLQFVHSGLPFGGVSASGFGRAHGFAGFKEFSNQRSLMAGNRFNPVKLIYPPLTPLKRKIIDLVFRYF